MPRHGTGAPWVESNTPHPCVSKHYPPPHPYSQKSAPVLIHDPEEKWNGTKRGANPASVKKRKKNATPSMSCCLYSSVSAETPLSVDHLKDRWKFQYTHRAFTPKQKELALFEQHTNSLNKHTSKLSNKIHWLAALQSHLVIEVALTSLPAFVCLFVCFLFFISISSMPRALYVHLILSILQSPSPVFGYADWNKWKDGALGIDESTNKDILY